MYVHIGVCLSLPLLSLPLLLLLLLYSAVWSRQRVLEEPLAQDRLVAVHDPTRRLLWRLRDQMLGWERILPWCSQQDPLRLTLCLKLVR